MVAWPCVECSHEVHGHKPGASGWTCLIDGCLCRGNPLRLEEKAAGEGYRPDLGKPDVKRRRSLFVGCLAVLALLVAVGVIFGSDLAAYSDGKALCDEAAEYHGGLARDQNLTAEERALHEDKALRFEELDAFGSSCTWWRKP